MLNFDDYRDKNEEYIKKLHQFYLELVNSYERYLEQFDVSWISLKEFEELYIKEALWSRNIRKEKINAMGFTAMGER